MMNPMRKYFSRSCALFTVVAAASSNNHPNSPHFVSKSLCEDTKDLKAFSPNEFRSFPVTKITTLSHNTKAFEVALPTAEHETGMAVSSCIMVKGTDGVAKPYTPTTLTDDKGSFELVIKAYPGGKVSGFLHNLAVGDNIEVKGPFPKLAIKTNMKKYIGMLCGGTGITPMLQVIKELLKNPDDKTELSLVFANDTEDDILLKSTLDALAKQHPNFKVTYVLSKPVFQFGWEGEVGFVNKVFNVLFTSTLVYSTLDLLQRTLLYHNDFVITRTSWLKPCQHHRQIPLYWYVVLQDSWRLSQVTKLLESLVGNKDFRFIFPTLHIYHITITSHESLRTSS